MLLVSYHEVILWFWVGQLGLRVHKYSNPMGLVEFSDDLLLRTPFEYLEKLIGQVHCRQCFSNMIELLLHLARVGP